MSAKSETKIEKKHKSNSSKDNKQIQLNEGDLLKSDEKPIRICLYGDQSVGKSTLKKKLREMIARNDSGKFHNVEIFTMKAFDTETPSSANFIPNFKIHADIIFVLFDLSTPQDKKVVKARCKKIETANKNKFTVGIGTKTDSPHADNEKLYTLKPKCGKVFHYAVSAENEINLEYLLDNSLTNLAVNKVRSYAINNM